MTNSPTNIFTYGSLMCNDIMEKVAGCSARSAAATLNDYFRSSIKAEEYPGITYRQRSSVTGIVYFDLSDLAVARLDIFEGVMYDRRTVEVLLEDKSPVIADVYVIRKSFEQLLTGIEWSFETFMRSGKQKFEQQYAGFQAR